jgi:hypothetical protein
LLEVESGVLRIKTKQSLIRRRVNAAVLDWVFVILVWFALAAWMIDYRQTRAWHIVPLFVWPPLYCSLSIFKGFTVGEDSEGLRVFGNDNNPATRKLLLIRWFINTLPPNLFHSAFVFGFIFGDATGTIFLDFAGAVALLFVSLSAWAFARHGQSIVDVLAGTKVVRSNAFQDGQLGFPVLPLAGPVIQPETRDPKSGAEECGQGNSR